MQGRATDPEQARQLMAADPTDWAAYRPDILGTVTVGHDGTPGRWRSTSPPRRPHVRARAKEPPPEMHAMMEEMQSLAIGEPTSSTCVTRG